jgi:hypothetical protein
MPTATPVDPTEFPHHHHSAGSTLGVKKIRKAKRAIRGPLTLGEVVKVGRHNLQLHAVQGHHFVFKETTKAVGGGPAKKKRNKLGHDEKAAKLSRAHRMMKRANAILTGT